jgi:thioredoxin reductase (NADPH)
LNLDYQKIVANITYMEKKSPAEEVIIIGAGPAGLTAALYAARSNLYPLVLTGSPQRSQITTTEEIENFPALGPLKGPELVEKMITQAKKFGARIVNDEVTEVNFRKRPFTIRVSENKFYQASLVIVATGAKMLWLGLPSEQRLIGRGVSACAICDGFFFKGKIVAVIGGGNAALEEALTLTKTAKKVYLIHRRNTFRATKVMQERVFDSSKIEIIWGAEVKEVLGENKVEGVKLKIKEEKEKVLPLDGLFIAIGRRPDTEVFKGQLEKDREGYILTNFNINPSMIPPVMLRKFNPDYRFITSVEGVFAAGDCIDRDYRQASTAAGMGAMAALEVERWLEREL